MNWRGWCEARLSQIPNEKLEAIQKWLEEYHKEN